MGIRQETSTLSSTKQTVLREDDEAERKASREGAWRAPALPGQGSGSTMHQDPRQGPEPLQAGVGKGESLRKGSSQDRGGAQLPEKEPVAGEEQEAVASPVGWAGPAVLPRALSPERLHSVFAFRFIQVPQKTERGTV